MWRWRGVKVVSVGTGTDPDQQVDDLELLVTQLRDSVQTTAGEIDQARESHEELMTGQQL